MDMTIANNVKALREMRPWTQEELATVAGTSARTIQRIERGEPASIDTLRALAEAFDVTIDVLRTSPEQWASVAEELKKVEERYRIVRLEPIERASALTPLMGGMGCMLFDNVPLSNDAEEDAVSALRSYLTDVLDVWSEISRDSQRSSEREIQAMIESLGALGFIVAAGAEHRKFRTGPGDASPMLMRVLYIMVSRTDDPKTVIGIDKTAPVQFA